MGWACGSSLGSARRTLYPISYRALGSSQIKELYCSVKGENTGEGGVERKRKGKTKQGGRMKKWKRKQGREEKRKGGGERKGEIRSVCTLGRDCILQPGRQS